MRAFPLATMRHLDGNVHDIEFGNVRCDQFQRHHLSSTGKVMLTNEIHDMVLFCSFQSAVLAIGGVETKLVPAPDSPKG